jgi:hypothetical protein
MNKTPIIGFIRYSCRAPFSRNDFFLPKYLDYRLGIFKNVTLKSFQEQTDKDFNIFLLHSENLPQDYKNIFNDLEKNNSFLYNIYIPDSEIEGKDYINAVERSIEYVNFCNDVSINFRIDNDDAVSRDFISKLKNFLKPEFSGFIISFPNVTIIQRIKKNKYIIQEKYFPSNSIGLAYVTNINNYQTIMTLGDHGKVNQKHPMALLPGKGGIQTINGKNVMNSLYFGHVSFMDEDALSAFLKKNGYSDFDFKSLNICKRRIFRDTVIKIKNFIKKNIITKT